MTNIQEKIIEKFGNRLRVRVCGICIENERILLVNHHSLNSKGDFWAPPGGGIDFGHSAEENLKREFKEETGLTIDIEEFLFVNEYLNPPLHAIELIFRVKKIGGSIRVGIDPELAESEQIIKNVSFMSFGEIGKFKAQSIHHMFRNTKNISQLTDLKGYFLGNQNINENKDFE